MFAVYQDTGKALQRKSVLKIAVNFGAKADAIFI